MTDIPSLLVLPEPILDESPSSWMMRLCQYHQSWPNQVCSVLGLRRMTDFDAQLSLEPLRRLAYATSVEDLSLVCLDSQFLHIRRREQRRAAFLLQGSPHGYAAYRYCPLCLREDPMPYWRLTWRMAHFHICPEHRCVMLDRCQTCNAMLEVFPTRKAGFFEGSDQPICRFCPACRADLGRFQSESLPDCELLRDVLALQDVVTAALLHGYFSICGVEDRFSLEDLPKILIMGATRCVVGSNSQAQAPVAARLAKSLQRASERARRGGLASRQGQPTPDSHPGDRLRRWAIAAWAVRFLNVIDEIRQFASDQPVSSESESTESLNL